MEQRKNINHNFRPLVSVVMSVYNEPLEWVRQSIDSILNQTFHDFEFIIINDNPDGFGQKALLKEYSLKDCRIILIENKKNIGLTKSLNIGISRSSGKYIARMDADDISMPNRFQVQYDFLESNTEVDICGSSAKLFGDVSIFSKRKIVMPEKDSIIKLRSLVYSPMIHPSVMFRKERLPKVLYNENFIKAQDYVLWGELIENGYVFYNLQDFLIRYRITSKSQDKGYKSKQFISANTVREKLLSRFFPDCDSSSIELHNFVCNEQTCDIKKAEAWLLKFKQLLINKFPVHEKEINLLIQRLWVTTNLINGVRYREFKHSPLTEQVSVKNYLRFFKRHLI